VRTSIDAGILTGMDDGLRKITVEVPAHDLAMAQELTRGGVSETVRAALKKLASIQAQRRLLKLRGRVKFDLTLEEMRYDRE
jgi:Arc/MetJ-type ribon-helix-helix transcriptional regulator